VRSLGLTGPKYVGSQRTSSLFVKYQWCFTEIENGNITTPEAIRKPILPPEPNNINQYREGNSVSFRDHFDGAAGVFGNAEATFLTEVVIELKAVARLQLDDCIIGTNAIAIFAFETVAAGQARGVLDDQSIRFLNGFPQSDFFIVEPAERHHRFSHAL